MPLYRALYLQRNLYSERLSNTAAERDKLLANQYRKYMEIFAELSIIIVIAAVVAGFMRVLRQPLIVGHILTGLIVGPFVLNLIHSTETIALLGNIGVAILLFTVGIHLSPDILRKFGRVSVITGVGQVLFTTIAGYVICILLGYSPLESFYIGVALAFSSTIIIMKLISDKEIWRYCTQK